MENRTVFEMRNTCEAVWRTACVFLVLLAAGVASGAETTASKPLPEGTILEGVDGRLIPGDANDTWLFELSEDVNSIGGPVSAGTRLGVLPSAMLEMVIADANERHAPAYRFWAFVTTYQGRNFLFPTYYPLPLSKLKSEAGPEATGREAGRDDFLSRRSPGTAGPDGELPIPQEIIDMLGQRRASARPPRPQTPGDANAVTQPLTRAMADEIGRLRTDEQGYVFVPDAFGLNVSRNRYRLLPCSALEQLVRQQAAVPEPIRFRVAGLVTRFKGREYLLLQRATPVYNYGNFNR